MSHMIVMLSVVVLFVVMLNVVAAFLSVVESAYVVFCVIRPEEIKLHLKLKGRFSLMAS